MARNERHTYFASCAPGVEALLLGEVRALGLARAEQQVGGVYFEGTLHDAWRANLWLRTAIRIFLRVGRFHARNTDELYAGASEVDWARYVEPEGTLIVDSQSRDSELFHTHFIQQRVKDAIVDGFRERLGVRPSVEVDDPDLRIHAHLFRDRVTLSVDTSGGSLHKRGWRVHQGPAPLSETTAAAVLLASGWDRRSPLLDPFCGSGTLAVEAALLASNYPPGAFRRFGFERFPGHDADQWERFREEEVRRAQPPRKLQILATDRDREQVERAQENIASAGMTELVKVSRADALRFAPRPGWNAWVVSNPPYGVRVGEGERLDELYREFGALLRERCPGYTAAILLGTPAHSKALGLKRCERLALKNGALDCELRVLRIPESVGQ